MREFRVQGPPGTGKTEYVRRQVQHAAEHYGAGRVVVCSLTRAAASHVARVAEGIPRENVGTLHSLAFRAIPGAKIAEAETAKFNEWCAEQKQPNMKLGAGNRATEKDLDHDDLVETPAAGETTGDKLQGEMNRYRARMFPRALWPESVRAFDTFWKRWKTESGLLDFTDLLEIALRDVAECPAKPGAFLADESQDFPRLAFNLARKWGEKCLRFIHVGDPDQVLYGWAGVDVKAFYEGNLPDAQTRLLSKSFRVPKAVHAAALRWINATPGRKPIEYHPRESEGEIRRCNATTFNPRLAIDDAKRRIGEGKTCLFLVSCSYMLSPVVKALRDSGIPFHNPYRVTRGDWNPLRIGGASPAARLAAYLRIHPEHAGESARLWTWQDLKQWSEWLPVGTALHRGARTAIAEKAKDEATRYAPVSIGELETLITEDAAAAALAGDWEWLVNNTDAKHREKWAYPLAVFGANGYAALTTEPKAIVSTIHAAKGGEADTVYLFPDLSPNAWQEWGRAGDGREGIRRAFYVALTRARETLVVCAPATNMAVRL